MRTPNGLRILRAHLPNGGFDIELSIPENEEGEEKPYAIIRRGNDDRWACGDDISFNVNQVIDWVDAQYARKEAQKKADAEQLEREYQQRDAAFAPAWEAIVERYGH